ncbi:tryptophanase leader peptide [Pseudarcicella hirudinis]
MHCNTNSWFTIDTKIS